MTQLWLSEQITQVLTSVVAIPEDLIDETFSKSQARKIRALRPGRQVTLRPGVVVFRDPEEQPEPPQPKPEWLHIRCGN